MVLLMRKGYIPWIIFRDGGSDDEEEMSQEDEEGDEDIRPTPSKKPRYNTR